MAARANDRGELLITGAVLCVLALASIALGASKLALLHSGFSSRDVLYPVGPRSTQAWLITLKTDNDNDVAEGAQRLASRLVLMTLPQRRRTLQAMRRPAFWVELSPDFVRQTRFRQMALAAVLHALESVPAGGDLWLAAARLRAAALGHDDQVNQYLEMSYLYAPRELDLAIGRVDMAVPVWATLAPALKAKAREDLDILKRANPARAEKIAKALKAAGADVQ